MELSYNEILHSWGRPDIHTNALSDPTLCIYPHWKVPPCGCSNLQHLGGTQQAQSELLRSRSVRVCE